VKARDWTRLLVLGLTPAMALASEADLMVPDLSGHFYLGGISGSGLLGLGLIICALGCLFGFFVYNQLRALPVHSSMREISELIYETCKTYLFTQGKFIMLLWAFIGTIIAVYFGLLNPIGASSGEILRNVIIILAFSLVGIAGSYGVAWFGIRVNTFANSRTAFASLKGSPYPVYAIPLKAGISIGTLLISIELVIMLAILLFVPGHLAGVCFIGFAIGESLGAAALRIAGGIFTKIADIGSDLMKIVFKIKEDDARNPGVIADCTGDNAGDSVGPTADGFETYGVTGVALISFILLAVQETFRVDLLVWIFVMRVMMIITSVASYYINEAFAKARYCQRAQDGLRGPPDQPGLADLRHLHRDDLPHQLRPDRPHGRRHPVVETGHHHHLRHAGRRRDTRAGEGVHLHLVRTREGSGEVLRGRWRLAGHPERFRGRQLQRLLAGPGHPDPDGCRVRRGFHRPRGHHGGARDLRVRPGGLRFPGHGPCDHRRGFLRPRDRQRPVRVRTVHHRVDSRRGGEHPEGVRFHARLGSGQGLPGGERRRRQHLQGHGQTRADRYRRGGCHHPDLLDHRAAGPRPCRFARRCRDHPGRPGQRCRACSRCCTPRSCWVW
jgi:hypothetical protein